MSPTRPGVVHQIASNSAGETPPPFDSLVVLDERQLEGSLEQTIRDVRYANPGARILVIGDDTVPDAVLVPHPNERTTGPNRPTDLSRVEEAVQRVGVAWRQTAEIMAQWMHEGEALVGALRAAVGDHDSARAAEQVKRLGEIHAWMVATNLAATYEATKASEGMEPHNTAVLIRDAAQVIHQAQPDLNLQLPRLHGAPRVMCRAGAACETFHLAFQAVAARVGPAATIRAEVEEGNLFVLHRFCGEPRREPPTVIPETVVQRLRHLVVEVHRGRLFPGRGRAAGEELVVALPNRRHETRRLRSPVL